MRDKASLLPCRGVLLIFQAGFLECLSSNYLLLSPHRRFPFVAFSSVHLNGLLVATA